MTARHTGQRIDRWLWHARITRTRTLAARLAAAGKIRLNRVRVTRASQPVHADDVLTITLAAGVRIVRVADFAERRAGAGAARLLYEDLADWPPPRAPRDPLKGPVASRAPGTGRPTKRERRLTDALKRGGD